MTDNLFNPESIGSLTHWWTGIIVSDESWKGNQEAEKWSSVDKLPGWGARYKVRIVSKHSKNKNRLNDNNLELCEVLYPVTGGSGHAGSYQTSNLRQGSVVFGVYKDGIDGNEPLILGCIGNNEQTLLKAKQETGFDPVRGYKLGVAIANYSLPDSGGDGQGGKPETPTESNTLSTPQQTTLADASQAEDQRQSIDVATTSTCEPIQLTGIAKTISNLIQDIERVKKEVNDWRYKLTNELISENGQKFGLDQYIAYKVENAARAISGWFKNFIFEIKKRITENIEKGARNLYYLLFPNARPKAKATLETAMDLLNCLFRKILGNLISMITKALLGAVDRFINVPLCAAENILSGLIGKLTGLINSAVGAIMAPVNALLGAVDLAGDILSLVIEFLSYLSCDDNPQCSAIKEWSIYGGGGQGLSLDINSIINKVKGFASTVQQSIDPDNFDFDLDFSDVFANNCNVGEILCGPPTVEFFGGGGSGASGNAIVSATGEILGVDITSFGSGYTSAPIVRFVDGCGKGRGAVGRVIIDTVTVPISSTLPAGTTATTGTTGTTTTVGVVAVVMNNTGSGYLSAPDGDSGGDGRIWSKKDDTTVKRGDGTYDRPYAPGENIDLLPGDSIKLPSNTQEELGNEIINGGSYQTVNTAGSITAPVRPTSDVTRGDYPDLNDGRYPVILYLCGLEIDNAGFNYSEGDKIVIEPSKGASATAKFGAFGTLESVKIISQGEGFKEVPNIYIESETGFNAKLLPRFCIDRVSTDVVKEPGIQDMIVSVIDCVGKVPQVDFFRVPQ